MVNTCEHPVLGLFLLYKGQLPTRANLMGFIILCVRELLGDISTIHLLRGTLVALPYQLLVQKTKHIQFLSICLASTTLLAVIFIFLEMFFIGFHQLTRLGGSCWRLDSTESLFETFHCRRATVTIVSICFDVFWLHFDPPVLCF